MDKKTEKTHDGLEALSKVSGLKREEVDAIWKAVKENMATLEACDGPHAFVKKGEGLRAQWRCSKCGGEVGTRERKWYEEGLKHGAKRRKER